MYRRNFATGCGRRSRGSVEQLRTFRGAEAPQGGQVARGLVRSTTGVSRQSFPTPLADNANSFYPPRRREEKPHYQNFVANSHGPGRVRYFQTADSTE